MVRIGPDPSVSSIDIAASLGRSDISFTLGLEDTEKLLPVVLTCKHEHNYESLVPCSTALLPCSTFWIRVHVTVSIMVTLNCKESLTCDNDKG